MGLLYQQFTAQFPDRREQGIFLSEQGKDLVDQGSLPVDQGFLPTWQLLVLSRSRADARLSGQVLAIGMPFPAARYLGGLGVFLVPLS